MKKIVFFVSIMLLSMGASSAFASKSNTTAVPEKKENKLTEEEMSRLKNRVEEIRTMDKTNLTVTEKRELRKELRSIKASERRADGYIYVGGSTLIIIILILLLI